MATPSPMANEDQRFTEGFVVLADGADGGGGGGGDGDTTADAGQTRYQSGAQIGHAGAGGGGSGGGGLSGAGNDRHEHRAQGNTAESAQLAFDHGDLFLFGVAVFIGFKQGHGQGRDSSSSDQEHNDIHSKYLQRIVLGWEPESRSGRGVFVYDGRDWG